MFLKLEFSPMTLNVSLTPQLEELVRQKVSSGRYNSASEVVREALRLMDTYEGLRETALAKLRADVEAGWQQVEEGKVSDFDPEAVKRRGREKLAKIRKAKR
jgi:antitoxin ParD1/3/4